MSAPLRAEASTTTTAPESPLMTRLRRGKWSARGGVPGGNSLTSAPRAATASASAACSGGYVTSTPHPRTATGPRPPAPAAGARRARARTDNRTGPTHPRRRSPARRVLRPGRRAAPEHERRGDGRREGGRGGRGGPGQGGDV